MRALIILLTCFSVSCFGQPEKNWYYQNGVTEFDSVSTAIGFLATPSINSWEDIQFFNPDGSKYIFEKEALQAKPDYEIFVPLKVISESDKWYKVNFKGEKLYRKLDSTLKFRTWEQHILMSVAAVGFNPEANPIRKSPNDEAEKLYYYHDEFYHPVKIQEDWLLIKKYDQEYGWIKWKNGDKILIDIFYLL